MKTKHIYPLLIGIIALGTAGFMGRSGEHGLVIHEWGTFTSLQGSDGVPLKWNPLESSQLPKFVYNWQHAGLGRYPSGLLVLGVKNVLVTLQRMETPVVYFYTDKEQTVDLTVRFPKGGITEWYPQAAQVGPSVVPPGPMITRLDSGLHRCGVSQNFTLASVFDGRNVKDSLIHWPDLRILPGAQHAEAAQLMPMDSKGSHYFAARDTDSAYVELASVSQTNSRPEYEKFLFYRGVGNFTTPLRVEMKSDNEVIVANTGTETLSHLFVLGIKDRAGNFVYLDELKPGEQKTAPLDLSQQSQPLATVRKQICEKMSRSLAAEGLYQREATAMVNTWKDSWFAEDGVRVLYVLPRTWTDQTLPMDINPKPKELVRVMVGRAELITPEIETQLTTELTQAQQGDPEAAREIHTMVKKLGRFAHPVFDRAVDRIHAGGEQRDKLMALLYENQKAN